MQGVSVSTVALASIGLYGFVVLLGRAAVQRLREGDAGWRGISGPPGSAQWWGGVLLAMAFVGFPLVALVAPVEPAPARWRLALGGLGFVLGFGLTLHAQMAMGRAWRIGVRERERTELCTDGPFRWCRNPVFSAMLLATGALIAWVPWMLAPWLVMLLALQLQVRVVEEPHLRRIHADAYRAYAARTGRFLPGVGRG